MNIPLEQIKANDKFHGKKFRFRRGQLISKDFLMSSFRPKNQRIFERISALASKKRSDQ